MRGALKENQCQSLSKEVRDILKKTPMKEKRNKVFYK